MAVANIEKMQRDSLAMSVASAVTAANEVALAQGVDPGQTLVTITEETRASGRFWRIHYGARDYVNQRGGDLIVVVDSSTSRVDQLIHGQ